jgi:hypothetical protein
MLDSVSPERADLICGGQKSVKTGQAKPFHIKPLSLIRFYDFIRGPKHGCQGSRLDNLTIGLR